MACTLPARCRSRRALAACAAPLALAGAFASGAARAAVADYQLERLVLEGDPDPVSGTLDQIYSDVDIDASGRVALWGHVGGVGKLFTVTGGVLAVAVTQGDTAPGTGGAVFLDVARPRIATPEVLAYMGIFNGQIGGFLRSGGMDSALMLPGDPAPGGGTVSQVSNIHSAAPGPWVAFAAQIDAGGPMPIAAHFVYGPTGLREVYRDDQAAPAGVGGVFSGVSSYHDAGVANDGSVAFGAEISGGSATSGIFRASVAGAITPLVLEGDAVATPGGGTFTLLAPFAVVNGAGDVVFFAEVLRPPSPFANEAVFVLESGGLREILMRFDPVPGASPASPLFGGLAGGSPPELSDTGVVAFAATLMDAGFTTTRHAVVVDDAGDLAVLVQEGDPVPGVPGTVFTHFTEVRVDATGRIAINAVTSAGAGVFLASKPPAIPALPPIALLALAAAVAASARGFGWIRTRSR